MKIKSIYPELLYDGAKLIITFAKGENRAVGKLFESIGGIDPKKDYEIIIRPKRKKRSLDANNYLWTLLGQLSERLNLPKTEVYREYIKEMDTYTIVPIKEDEIEGWARDWERGHDGWVCVDIGNCRNFKGYHNIKCFKGSGTFNTKQMSRLIDMVIYDCKEQGIETMTPREIEELKQKWGCG